MLARRCRKRPAGARTDSKTDDVQVTIVNNALSLEFAANDSFSRAVSDDPIRDFSDGDLHASSSAWVVDFPSHRCYCHGLHTVCQCRFARHYSKRARKVPSMTGASSFAALRSSPCCIDLDDHILDDFVGRIQAECPIRISLDMATQAAAAHPGNLPRAIAHGCRLSCSPPRGRVHVSGSQASRSRSPPARVIWPASVNDSSAAAALRTTPSDCVAPIDLSGVPASVGLPCFAADPQAEVEHYFSILANSAGLAAQDGNFWTSVPMYSQYTLHHSLDEVAQHSLDNLRLIKTQRLSVEHAAKLPRRLGYTTTLRMAVACEFLHRGCGLPAIFVFDRLV